MRTNNPLTRTATLAAVILSSAGALAATPRPTDQRVQDLARAQALALGAAPVLPSQPGGESSYVFSSIENGRTINLELRNGAVVRAEIDGKAVPDSRIERDGDTVRFKDENGEVIFEHDVTAAAINPFSRGAMSIGPRGIDRTWVLPGNAPNAPSAIVAPVETPKVMVGIQMATPDASLRGHLGLKEGESTMLSSVHEGLPAAKAGLGPYDIIVSIDGKSPAGLDDIRAALKDRKPGETIKFGVIQKGERKEVTLTLEAYDRKKLDESKVDAIADNLRWSDWNRDARAPIAESDTLRDLTRRLRESYGRGGSFSGSDPFIAVIPGPNGLDQRMLIDPNRLHRDASTQMEEMRRQMDELRKMMQDMLDQKPAPAQPQEPASPPKGESRS